MLESFMTVPVVIVSPSVGSNSVGDPIDVWEPPDSEVSASCWVEPLTSGEDNDLRQSDSELFRLFFQPNFTLKARDRFRFGDGSLMEAQGPVLLRRTVRGPHHQEIRCKSVVG